MTVAIRVATLEDARELAEVHLEGWRWGYRDILPADYLAGLDVDEWEAQWVGNFTATWADDMTALLAEEDGRGIGFIACGTAGTMFGPPPEGVGEVFAIYLREDAQGTGVGRALLEAGTAALRDRGLRRGPCSGCSTRPTIARGTSTRRRAGAPTVQPARTRSRASTTPSFATRASARASGPSRSTRARGRLGPRGPWPRTRSSRS